MKYVQAQDPLKKSTFFSPPKKEKSSVFGTVICSFCNNPTVYTATGYWCGPCGRYAYGAIAEDSKVCRKCHRQMIRYQNTGGWWCTVCRISEGGSKPASSGNMPKHRNKWDTAKLKDFPEWFQKREDSLELIRKILVKDDDPKIQDLEKTFDSVFVVCASFNEEDSDYKEGVKEVAELRGCDTVKELTEEISKEYGKEDIEFVYNTRKKVYLNVEVQAVVEEREFEDKDGVDTEEAKEEKPKAPATPPPAAPLGLKQGDITQDVNESTPGTVGGPRRA